MANSYFSFLRYATTKEHSNIIYVFMLWQWMYAGKNTIHYSRKMYVLLCDINKRNRGMKVSFSWGSINRIKMTISAFVTLIFWHIFHNDGIFLVFNPWTKMVYIFFFKFNWLLFVSINSIIYWAKISLIGLGINCWHLNNQAVTV